MRLSGTFRAASVVLQLLLLLNWPDKAKPSSHLRPLSGQTAVILRSDKATSSHNRPV